MARTAIFPGKTGPEWVTVQMQIRVPYWRRMQLLKIARDNGVTIPALLTDAIDRVHPPEPPK
jgi:hypothetical protein